MHHLVADDRWNTGRMPQKVIIDLNKHLSLPLQQLDVAGNVAPLLRYSDGKSHIAQIKKHTNILS